jgi:ComF family protein
MGPAALVRAAAALLAPPRCGACAAPCTAGDAICTGCAEELRRARPGRVAIAGVGPVSWAAPYEGVARELVGALKFQRRVGLAAVLAESIAIALGPCPPTIAVVAVPAAPARRRSRGFDPAELIARALAARLGLAPAAPLRRADGPRQVGRRRAERLLAPPRIWPVADAPERVLLVDDVLTTGATLQACAVALHRSGATEIRASVFARALGHRAG